MEPGLSSKEYQYVRCMAEYVSKHYRTDADDLTQVGCIHYVQGRVYKFAKWRMIDYARQDNILKTCAKTRTTQIMDSHLVYLFKGEEEIDNKRMLSNVFSHVMEMKTEWMLIFLLKFIFELDQKTISIMLNSSEASISRRVNNIRTFLSKRIRERKK